MASHRIARAAVCLIILAIALTSLFPASATAVAYEALPAGTFGAPGPTVYGDDRFKVSINTAMEKLQAEYPEDYLRVSSWISEIRPTDTYTQIDNHGICYIDPADATANPYWLAGVLVHEAQHTYDDSVYFSNHPYTARESEARALEVQAAYLGSVNSWTEDQVQSWVDGYLAQNYWETIPVKYGDSPLK
ncbi:hypothetical protein [Methanocella sp. MCL-LM]|uniref:hypothetical protein n=1 Tax=Methanocella sp. MCL-LM TaxID=3412035 RepID=UPI003C75E887